MNGGPLSNVTVIDASTIIAGPLTAALLGDYGARVIKVEHPREGDKARMNGTVIDGEGSWWAFLSRNKECVTCDLSTLAGANLFRLLTSKADIVIENFRPGRLEKWGLAPSVLQQENRGLIILRLSGFGQFGPYADRSAYGTVLEAMTGFVNMNGYPNDRPLLPGVPVADPTAGIMGAFAAMVALWSRNEQMSGSIIDLSLYGAMLQTMGLHLSEFERSGEVKHRNGNTMGTSPRNTQQCSDGGWVAYAVGQSSRIVSSMVSLVGLTEDERFSRPDQALANGRLLDDAVGRWIGLHSRVDVIDAFASRGIPIGPVNTASDVMSDDHFRERGDFHQFLESGRTLQLPDSPFRLSGWFNMDDQVRTTSATLGQHNRSVYCDFLGVTTSELELLIAEGAI